MDRRTFLTALAGSTAGLMLSSCSEDNPAAADSPAADRDRLGDLLPLRRLGRTGEVVTMLGVGGWHIGRMHEAAAQATIEKALEGGVRFFDSAESYQNGGSEEYLGRFLTPKYRDVAFLMTKTQAFDGGRARRDLEGSLRRLNTDYLDLWQLHNVESPEAADTRVGSVLDVMLEAKAEGKVRHIGFTGHRTPRAHLRVLELTDAFEACQMPVNVADASYESFSENVLPELVEREIGVIAMKTMANGGFFGGSRHGQHGDNPRVVPNRVSVEEAIHYVWSLPVSVLVSGPDNLSHMIEKISLARSFTGLDEATRKDLVTRVADMAGNSVEFYKD